MLAVKRKALNALRARKLHPAMRRRVMAIIQDLEGHGWEPLIDGAVHRTPAQQRELVRKGFSWTNFGFHNITAENGRAESLAADIVDARYLWKPPKRYWLMLAAAAEAHNCETGIYWGLEAEARRSILRAISTRSWEAPVPLGKDTAHVQPADVTLAEARHGKRPR